nr:hypothetical protein [bacterium]
VRIFKHAGFNIDPRTTPLTGKDGAQVISEGRPLTLADYVNYAAVHHFEALESILGFLEMQKGNTDYEAMSKAIVGRLNPGRT